MTTLFSFSIPQSPSPSSAELTSPSLPHTSPSLPHTSPGGDYTRLQHSPQPIDIRAQFLADLRRFGDHRPASPIEAEPSPTDYSPHNDSLPPRKRKVSAEEGEANTRITANGHLDVAGGVERRAQVN